MQVTVGSAAASFAQPSTSLSGLEEGQTGRGKQDSWDGAGGQSTQAKFGFSLLVREP